MRLDRLLTLYLSKPLALRRSPAGIPILMYHSISDVPEDDVHPFYRLNTSPEDFRRQCLFLRDHGYRTVSLAEAVRLLAASQSEEWERSVVLTFDDGYRDFYIHATPILCEFKMMSALFIPTSFISNNKLKFNGRKCLRWDEVRELARVGVEIGSHSVSHPRLNELPRRQVVQELAGSKTEIEQRLSQAVESFCYPYAFPEDATEFTAFLRATLMECGYRYGVTTILGTAKPCDDYYFLKRIPVNSGDDLRLFAAKLGGAYDWLHGPQLLFKKVRFQSS